jgi:trans-2,3-dihydro-3-hydroxyanthranilate isomerase
MGRPSEIGLTVLQHGGRLEEIRVAGSAVPVASGQIRVPDRVETGTDLG